MTDEATEATETTGTMKERELTPDECTISGIIKVIEEEMGADDDFWFRGQVRHEYRLVPGLFRGGVSYNEAGMLEDFRREYPEYENQHSQPIDWLTTMQHYGAPTRILDWSTNMLIGIYFAVKSMEYPDSDKYQADNKCLGSLYILNPSAFKYDGVEFQNQRSILTLNQYVSSPTPNAPIASIIEQSVKISIESSKEIESIKLLVADKSDRVEMSIFEVPSDLHNLVAQVQFLSESALKKIKGNLTQLSCTITYKKQPNSLLIIKDDSLDLLDTFPPRKFTPPHSNDRIRAQSGVFSMHDGYYFDGQAIKPFVPVEGIFGKHLLKINIPHKHKERLSRELSYAGVTFEKVFPEMENIVAMIKKRHEHDIRS